MANMKKGGAPTGKRLTTVLAEREKRERDNPSLKERRQEEERAKQRRFLASMSGDKPLLTSASTNISTASDAGMDLELSTNILATGAASEMSKDTVHSGASLGIGEGVSSRGIDNRFIHLPHAWDFVPLAVPPPVSEGWARKNVGRKSTKFTPAQVEFFRSMFDAHLHGGHKVKESEAYESMKTKFNDASTDSPYAKKFVLTKAQIKSWFSTEKGRRTAAGKRLVAKNLYGRNHPPHSCLLTSECS